MAASNNNFNGPGPANIVQGNARDLISSVNVYHSALPDPDPIFFNVHSPEINFVGRSDMLKSIEDAMETSNIIVIAGLGGVGKTQLVRKFIQQNRATYRNVIWINSENSESINESFKRLALVELNISITTSNGQVKDSNVIIEQALNKLSKSKTLCVYDNVDKVESISFLLTIEPSGSKPHVIITSRIQEWDDDINVKQLKVWEFDEAMIYVSTTLKHHMDEENDKKLLVEKLQHFPLALRQGTAYINYQRKERVFRIADYLQKYDASYRDTKEMLNSEVFRKAATNKYKKTTFTTWRITIDAIREDGAAGALAVRILNIIAYFDPDNIHRDIFIHLTGTSDNREGEELAENIRSAVRLLINYSMVDSQESQSVLSIHRLVQLVIKLDLTETKQDKAILRDALALISKLIKVKRLNFNVSHSHFISVFRSALNFDDLIQEVSELPHDILETLLKMGKFNQAKAFGNEIVEPVKRILGDDHPDTLKTRSNLAVSCARLGKRSEAIPMIEEVLEKRRVTLGEDHPETVATRNIFALLYTQFGKHSDANKIFEEVLEKLTLTVGEDHPKTLETRNFLGLSYFDQGNYSEASQVLKKVLEKQMVILGEDDQETLTTKYNLAFSYAQLGKHSDTIKNFEEILEKQRVTLGEHHQGTDTTRRILANFYQQVGKYSDAIQIWEELLKKLKLTLGEYHPDILQNRHNLAYLYGKQGKHSEAIQMLEEILEKQTMVLGEDNPATLTTRHNLAYFVKSKE